MKVSWTGAAESDLDDILGYVAKDSISAAEALLDRIEETAAGLTTLPDRGRPGTMGGTRELVVSGTPYLIVYRVDRAQVLILRVFHGARERPADI